MQVALLHEVTVDQGEPAHAGPGQGGGVKAAQGPAADDHGVAVEQPLLALGAERGELRLPRITFLVAGVHRENQRAPTRPRTDAISRLPLPASYNADWGLCEASC